MASESIFVQLLEVFDHDGNIVGWGELVICAKDGRYFQPLLYDLDNRELPVDMYFLRPNGKPQLMVSTRTIQ